MPCTASPRFRRHSSSGGMGAPSPLPSDLASGRVRRPARSSKHWWLSRPQVRPPNDGRPRLSAGAWNRGHARGPATRPTEAQSPRPVKIGALTDSWGPTPHIVGLRDGLQELGYRENENFVIGVRFTQGSIAELPEAALALVRRGVDLIVATENAATAAQLATTSIPIVFMGGGDPVGSGLVKSFARPGGNITGIADLELELVPKRMEIFRDLIPDLKRVVSVYDGANSGARSRLGSY